MARNRVTRRAVLRRAGVAGAVGVTGLAAGRTASARETAAQVVAVGPEGSLRFDPERFEITVGDTVKWVWESGGHNVSPTPGEQPAASDWAGDDADTYDEGHTHAHTFTAAGGYDYHCDPHRSLGMTGSFTVAEAPPPDVTGDGNRALDPDGDGRYEDVNGDGDATPGDATVLFDNVFEGDPAVTEHVSLFDFNGDGELAAGDATVLFDEVF
ncbi:MAG: plastocyanin/azurin family copper-binding protein [Haloarculaceae archaeon]